MYTTVQVCSKFGKFAYTAICMRNVYTEIIDDIIKTAVKTAEVDEQNTKCLQHFINKHDTIVSN
jgi:hypothetical protein